MNLFILPNYGLNSTTTVLKGGFWHLKVIKVDMLLNKKVKHMAEGVSKYTHLDLIYILIRYSKNTVNICKGVSMFFVRQNFDKGIMIIIP